MPDGTRLERHALVTGPDWRDQLALFFEWNDRGGDFHSLVWEKWVKGHWEPQAEITAQDFRNNAVRPRWVSDIHSLDPVNGLATICVGEDGEHRMGAMRCIYSWRMWDLKRNREVKLIKVCEQPGDPLGANDGG